MKIFIVFNNLFSLIIFLYAASKFLESIYPEQYGCLIKFMKELVFDFLYKSIYYYSYCQIQFNKIKDIYLLNVISTCKKNESNLFFIKNSEPIHDFYVDKENKLIHHNNYGHITHGIYDLIIYKDDKNIIVKNGELSHLDYNLSSCILFLVEILINNDEIIIQMKLSTNEYNFYVKDNFIDKNFVYYYLKNYANYDIKKIDNYKIKIIDNNVNIFELNENQTLIFTEDFYEIK